jgi:hypothetical protein
MKKNETTKFEFLFTLGGNIICQRYFNVKGYNNQVRKSMDLYETLREISEDIQSDLRKKSIQFLFENEKFSANQPEQVSGAAEEVFTMQIKIGDDVIIGRQFPASIYPPKVRYTVDIRPEIRNILALLTETLSLDEYETTYLETEL